MDYLKMAKDYWNSFDGKPPPALVYGLGGGGEIEIPYRHFFELKHLQRVVKFNEHMNVLELGCGSGRWAISIAPKVKNYVGVDFSRNLLLLAEQEARKKNIFNIKFIESSVIDYTSTDIFDIVYFSGVTQYLSDEHFIGVLHNIDNSLLPNSIIIDRSTVNFMKRNIRYDNYFSIYRTPSELTTIYDSFGFKLEYQKRSYRYLRLSNYLKRLNINNVLLTLINKMKPFSFYTMWFISSLADIIAPNDMHGMSHDFSIFRRGINVEQI